MSYDNDGFTDLAVSFGEGILLLHNEKNGSFRDVAAAAGIKNVGIDGLTFIDYDHDGDLDLYAASGMMMVVGASKSGTSYYVAEQWKWHFYQCRLRSIDLH